MDKADILERVVEAHRWRDIALMLAALNDDELASLRRWYRRTGRAHARRAVGDWAAPGLVVPDGGRWRTGAPGHEQWVELGGAHPTCTCRWWARYRGDRRPCTHVLAATLAENARTR